MLANTTLPFRMRPDLQVTCVEWSGQLWYVLKDPLSLSYVHLAPLQYLALQMLSDATSVRHWAELLDSRGQTRVSWSDLRQWLREFVSARLVVGERWVPSNLEVKSDRSRSGWHRLLINPLYLHGPSFDPQRILKCLDPWAGWLFRPGVIAILLTLVTLVWLQSLIHAEEFLRRLPGWTSLQQTSSWVSIWLMIGFSKIVHELAHGIAAHRAGAECHRIGMALVLFAPALSCDVTDAWRLPRCRDRLGIALAGIYAETVLGGLALALWWITAPGPWHDALWYLTAVTSLSTLLINLNPLARYDGYFALCDLVGQPNLRQEAAASLDRLLARGLHRGPDLTVLPRSLWHEGLLASYAVLSSAYQLFIIVSTIVLLQAWLSPLGLEIIVAVFAASSTIVLLVQGWRRIARVFAQGDRWRLPLSNLLLVGAAAVALMMLAAMPVAWPQSAPCVLDVADGESLFVTTPGRLVRVCVPAGVMVSAGELLAELENTELDRQRLQLLVRCAQQEKIVAAARARGETALEADSEVTLKSLTDQLAELDRRREQLQLRAPCDGVYFPPVWKEDSSSDGDRLPSWNGQPLSSLSQGAWLEVGTCVAVVAPPGARKIVAQVGAGERAGLSVGQSLKIQPTSCPAQRWAGRVVQLSDRAVADWPAELSAYRTETTADAPTTTYPVEIALDHNTVSPLPVGTTGCARWSTPARPLAEQLWMVLLRSLPAWW